jgi:hypothetical protein
MTVACDEGARAQAGVLHRDGRRAAPTERRETRTVASVLRVTARAARCFSFSTRRSYCELQRARAQRGPERPNLEDPFSTKTPPHKTPPLALAQTRRPAAPLVNFSPGPPCRLTSSAPTLSNNTIANIRKFPCHRRWSLTLGVGASVVGTRAPLVM